MLNPFTHQCNRLTLLLLGLLEHLLDDLLLLDQESADNAVLDAAGAPRSTVRTLDGLLGRRAGTPWSLVPQSCQSLITASSVFAGQTYTALGGSALLLDVQVTELTAGSLDDADLLALGVVWRTSPLPIVSLQAHIFHVLNGYIQRSRLRCDVRR
jgi:hypothetical protein